MVNKKEAWVKVSLSVLNCNPHWTASLMSFFSCSQTWLVVWPFWEDEVIEKDQQGSGVLSFHFIFPSHSPATIFVFMKSGPMSQIPVNYKPLSPPASIPDDLAPGKRSRSSQGSSWKSPSVPSPAFCFETSRVLSQGFCSPWSPHLLASGRDAQMAEKYKKGALDQESRELWSNPSSILPELCDLDHMTVPFFFFFDAEAETQRFFFCFLFFFNFFYFIFWLRWVFVAAHRLSLVAVSGGYSSLRCVGFSLRWLLLLRSTGSRHAGFSRCGSRALEHRLSSYWRTGLAAPRMWDLPGPGLEPVSPALAGGFLTTAPPGKPPS